MVFGLPPAVGGIGLAAVATFVLTLYVIYDMLVSDKMILLEKLIWIVLTAFLNLVGIALYLFMVKYQGELIADHTDLKGVQQNIGK